MQDLDLIDLLASRLEAYVTLANWQTRYFKQDTAQWVTEAWPVVQKEQPEQAGTTYRGAIYFQKLYDERWGQPKHTMVWDATAMQFVETETQLIASTFGVYVHVIQDPNDTTIPTPSDAVNQLSQFLAHHATIRLWKTSGVNLLKIKIVDNPYFEDDRHRAEAEAQFKITLAHDRSLSINVDGTDQVVGATYSAAPNNAGTFPLIAN